MFKNMCKNGWENWGQKSLKMRSPAEGIFYQGGIFFDFFVIFLHGVLEVLGCLLGGSWAS